MKIYNIIPSGRTTRITWRIWHLNQFRAVRFVFLTTLPPENEKRLTKKLQHRQAEARGVGKDEAAVGDADAAEAVVADEQVAVEVSEIG